MILPGIQALLGFQLIAVCSPRFVELAEVDRAIHLAAFVLVAIAVALVMTPAAYHRQVTPESVSVEFVRRSSRLITWALAPLAMAISLDAYVLSRLVLRERWGALLLALFVGALFVGAWFVFPRMARRRLE